MRSTPRTLLLVFSLIECLARFAVRRLHLRRLLTVRERAVWLHESCFRITQRLGIDLATRGTLPSRGLVVSNHLSHLDILSYGALGPIVFVAKKDVRRWPLLGQLASCGGTVFVDRERSAEAAETARQIEDLLRGDVPVLLFPEGTSSDGTSLLPFKPPLFEAAVRAGCPVTAAAIAYSADGVSEGTLAYYGDKVFFPHLHQTLGHRRLSIGVRFADRAEVFLHRKEAARVTHERVSVLREQPIIRGGAQTEGALHQSCAYGMPNEAIK